LEGVTITGTDFEELVTLFHGNLDLIETSLMDLPETDIMLHKIDRVIAHQSANAFIDKHHRIV